MLKNESQRRETDAEISPAYSTSADIAFAEKLRRELEERYFGPSAGNPTATPRPGDAD